MGKGRNSPSDSLKSHVAWFRTPADWMLIFFACDNRVFEWSHLLSVKLRKHWLLMFNRDFLLAWNNVLLGSNLLYCVANVGLCYIFYNINFSQLPCHAVLYSTDSLSINNTWYLKQIAVCFWVFLEKLRFRGHNWNTFI